ncbi:MAG: hypothetical protein PVH15_08970, partial [Syntrophobacterales bacterium]
NESHSSIVASELAANSLHFGAPWSHDKKLTTEAQSTQRMLFFPWPGDDGQGKEPPPAANALEPGSNR